MDQKQVLPIIFDEIYRCGKTSRAQAGNEKSNDPANEIDTALKEKINSALWQDDVLRVTDYNEIDIYVKNRIVYLSGHMISATNEQRVKKVLQTIGGIYGFINNLVMDDELMYEVATSLGQLEKIHHCKFFTGVSNGFVTLNGEVSNTKVRLLAEQCAASHANVRGVINYIRIPGIDLGIQDQRLLQPPIGKEIYFRDGLSGIVQQVVINPDNRRVIAMAIQGNIYDSRQNPTLSNNSFAQPAKQLLFIPLDVVEYLTKDSGFLTIKSTDFTRYQKFDATLFAAPDKDWRPPYPYCPEDVLFPIHTQLEDSKTGNIPNPASALLETEEQIHSGDLLANDSLGG
jgi:osmotically-inducible protein OsmY